MIEITDDAAAYEQDGGNVLWIGAAIFGALCLCAGIALLVNIRSSAATLVALVAFTFLVAGIGGLIVASPRSAWRWIASAVLIAGGIAALAWPDMTLWALAVVGGLTLLIAGVAEMVDALIRPSREGRRWFGVLNGLLAFVAGAVVLAWPGATVFVLAVIFAVRVIGLGLTMLVAARDMYRQQSLPPGAIA